MDNICEYKKVLLNIINKYSQYQRKSKYTNSYYLDKILLILQDVVTWKSLENIFKFPKKYHFKTIYNKYLLWCGLGIFKEAFDFLIGTKKFAYINSSKTINLYIDSSLINNKSGIESIGYAKCRKKKVTKISFICDNTKCPLSVTFSPGLSIPDVKTIKPSIDEIINNCNFRKINLIGDKGYISRKIKNYYKTKKIKIITPYRRNQIIKTTKIEKGHLHNRYKVEHSFQNIKKFNRVYVRRDRKLLTYSSFVYLAIMTTFFK